MSLEETEGVMTAQEAGTIRTPLEETEETDQFCAGTSTTFY